MRRARVVAAIVLGAALALLLFDWTVGALDVFRIGRLADARLVRAAMHELPGRGGLVHDPGLELELGGGRFAFRTGQSGARIGAVAAEVPEPVLRIVVLGDGAALGWGVDDALTFARGLEREFGIDGRPVRVTNAAHLFFDLGELSAQREYWASRAFDGAPPDLWLLCGPAVEGAPEPAIRAIGGGAGQERSWWGRVLPALWELKRTLGEEDAAQAPPPGDRTALERALLGASGGAGGLAVVVDLGGDPELTAACERLGLRRIDAGFTVDELRLPLFVDPANGWPNSPGHDRIRERVAQGLVELGVLAAQRASR